MNTNIKIYRIAFTLFLLSWTVFFPATAQDYKGKTKIKPELVLSGDSLHLNMSINLEGLSVDPDRSLTLTPVVSGGDRSKRLPSVLINGQQRHKLYRRYQAMDRIGSTKGVVETEIAKKAPAGYSKEIKYHAALLFEEWMNGADLNLEEDLCGCAGYTQQISIEPLAVIMREERPPVAMPAPEIPAPTPPLAEPYRPVMHLAYLRPACEEVKQREGQADLYIEFEVNKTNILPDFKGNRAELDRVNALIGEMRSDKGITIQKIDIMGYASPEGPLDENIRLSEGRAKALKDYLQQRFDILPSHYNVGSGGENWAGLEEMIRQSGMYYKQEVLDIISRYTIIGGRETQLMKLAGGVPFNYMRQNMFPRLRKVVCKIDYRVKAYTVEEAGEMLRTRPQNLSMEEMYAVAATLEPGSAQYNEVFETAVRMFPEDGTANLNAAASSLQSGNWKQAENYLDKSNPFTAEYMNNRGVYELLKGNHEQARVWLEKAKANGAKQAAHNLKELEKK